MTAKEKTFKPLNDSSTTKVWFSILADTTNDTDDSLLWSQEEGPGTIAHRAPLTETEPFDL